jgi:hypothetical protein
VWRDIIFCLIVNDFGIKTTSRNHVIHLKESLEKHYTGAIDWDGSLFCGINIDWMAKYIPKALRKFQHSKPVFPQHQPYQNTPIQYGAHIQRVDINTSTPLTPEAIKRVQDIVSTLLYYG